jgi:hypothetical protein
MELNEFMRQVFVAGQKKITPKTHGIEMTYVDYNEINKELCLIGRFTGSDAGLKLTSMLGFEVSLAMHNTNKGELVFYPKPQPTYAEQRLSSIHRIDKKIENKAQVSLTLTDKIL